MKINITSQSALIGINSNRAQLSVKSNQAELKVRNGQSQVKPKKLIGEMRIDVDKPQDDIGLLDIYDFINKNKHMSIDAGLRKIKKIANEGDLLGSLPSASNGISRLAKKSLEENMTPVNISIMPKHMADVEVDIPLYPIAEVEATEVEVNSRVNRASITASKHQVEVYLKQKAKLEVHALDKAI